VGELLVCGGGTNGVVSKFAITAENILGDIAKYIEKKLE
jgi:hypothetical protein